MTANPKTILQDDTIHLALERMEEVGCHHLPVLSDDNHLVGIVSSRDCMMVLELPYSEMEAWRVTALALHTPVRKAMTPAPIVVEPSTLVIDAARLMLTHHISCLPVMRGETLVGIITDSDLLIALIRVLGGSTASLLPAN